MNPARTTIGILVGAVLVAGVASLLTAMSAPPPAATPTTQGRGGITASVLLQSSHVLRGSHETHMAVTVRAPDGPEQPQRPPVNLALVIDRSGSMAGDKLANAKAAAQHLVSQLRANDHIAVVTYGTDVSVPLRTTAATAEGKAAALHAIERIYDDGGTNLSGGLIAGRDELLPHHNSQSISRVVLISDGLANEGLTDPTELARLAQATAERGVSITTVGVGLDFDEQTMTHIAVTGAGNYYFAESAATLPALFSDELDKLGATVATELRVTIAPMPGVQVLEAYGYELNVDSEGRRSVTVADLHAGQVRKLVVRLQVDARGAGQLQLASIEVSYQPIGRTQRERVALSAHARVADQKQIVVRGRNPDAARHIERARTARAIDEATVLYEQGDHAGAAKVLQSRARITQELTDSEELQDLNAELSSATTQAQRNFAEAPIQAAPAGKKARKQNRKAGYDLMY